MKHLLTLSACLLLTFTGLSTATAEEPCAETTHAKKMAELDELEAVALRDDDERVLLEVHAKRLELRRERQLAQRKVDLKRDDRSDS